MGRRFERAATRSRTAVEDWRDVTHLVAVVARLRRVQLGCDEALRVIARFDGPDSLRYVDPPCPASTRGARWATCAYADELTDDGHRRLADVLYSLRGMAVVSGYPCPLYREPYGGWPTAVREARTHGPRAATEVLWLSPRAASRLPVRQLRLCGMDGPDHPPPGLESAP